MIAVDTKVLVRILVEDLDQPAQTTAARELASRAKQVFVPLIVQVETVWVLESGYKLRKENVAQVLEHLEVNQAFILENEELCHSALELYRSSNTDYSDCIILTHCRTQDLNLYTFDKHLSKLAGATLLQRET
jgi:predicted nucleic-acid-binding protein